MQWRELAGGAGPRLSRLPPRSSFLLKLLVEGSPNAGPLGRMSPAERFHWLTHPRSTTIQVSPVHSGLCDNPQAALDDLFARLVE